MQGTVRNGLVVGVADFVFGAPVADPTQLTFAIDDGTKAQIITNAVSGAGETASTEYGVNLGYAKIHGLVVGTIHITATDNSSSGPQSSTPLAMTVTQMGPELWVILA